MNTNGQTAGMVVREDGLAGRELAMLAETQSTAIAAQARAQVEARYKLALARPRDYDDFRLRLLNACRRPKFAELAKWVLPRGGKKLSGPSIRFVEEALRCFANVLPETSIIFDDETKRIVRVSVTDLESNITYTHEVIVAKTLERKKPESFEVLGQRKNSFGDVVYIVKATEDDLLMKQNAMVSKALRTVALRILPSEVVEEALALADETFAKGDEAEDPAKAQKSIADAFASVGVMPSALKEYLGCDLAQTSPAQRQELRRVYATIRDGAATWQEIMTERKGAEPATAGTSQADRLKAQMGKQPDAKSEEKPADAKPEPAKRGKATKAAPPEPVVPVSPMPTPAETPAAIASPAVSSGLAAMLAEIGALESQEAADRWQVDAGDRWRALPDDEQAKALRAWTAKLNALAGQA